MKKSFVAAGAVLAFALPAVAGNVIYSNGPIITDPDGLTCSNNPPDDWSKLQNVSLLMNILGFGHQSAANINNRVADDFTVPDGEKWVIDELCFYAYQTNATNSTITDVNYRIWDGPPGAGGNIVHDFSGANQMTSTVVTEIYRASENCFPCCTRLQQLQTVNGNGISLEAGTYWLDWQTGGTASSGPWVAPITILGQTNTGNGRQFIGSSQTWQDLIDTGTDGAQNFPQGVPFVLKGEVLTGGCVADITAAEVVFGSNEGPKDPTKLETDDNDRVLSSSKTFLSAQEPNLAHLLVTSNAANCLGGGVAAEVFIQDQASQPNVTNRVRLRPAGGGAPVQIAQYGVTFNVDSDHPIAVADMSPFIAGNGDIKMDLRYSTIALLSPLGFTARTDVATTTF